MPNYDYTCDGCKVTWTENVPVASRNEPTKKACPHCKKEGCVKREISVAPLIYSGIKSALTRAGDGWQEVQSKILEKQGLNHPRMKGRHNIKRR